MLAEEGPTVSLLRVPHPYRAILAISNDCDGMPLHLFERLHAFLNTRDETEFGEGIGLDVSDSMWIYAPQSKDAPLRHRVLSLKDGLTTDASEHMAETLAHYVEAGWIDTLHSLGNFNPAPILDCRPTKKHLVEATRAFKRYGISLPVWVNHGKDCNIQNIGVKGYMQGGQPGSDVYAWPYVRDMGVHFVNGREYPHELGLRGLEKMTFGDNSIWSFSRWYSRQLQDGEILDGVRRTIDRDGKIVSAYVWHPSSLHHQLCPAVLDRLVLEGGSAIFAQHLGYKVGDKYPVTALSALRLLKDYQDKGLILVARTSRLLRYERVRNGIHFQSSKASDRLTIVLGHIDDEIDGKLVPTLEDVRGLSFHIEGWAGPVQITIGGIKCPNSEVLAETLATGQIVSIKWHQPDHRAHHKGTSYIKPWRRYVSIPLAKLSASALDHPAPRRLKIAVQMVGEKGAVHTARYAATKMRKRLK